MAPVDGKARMVKSKSKPCWPHLVQVLSRGEVVCDENCGHRSRFAHIAWLLHTQEVVCDENYGHRSRFAHIAWLLHTLWDVSVILSLG